MDVEVECRNIGEHNDVDSVVSESKESPWDYGRYSENNA